MILVDSSIWFDHFNRNDDQLVALLEQDRVLIHPFVIAEIALGSLRNRNNVLRDLHALTAAEVARHDEVMAFIDHHGLAGAGIGYVDAHLLASAILTQACLLWSRDKRLAAAALRLGIAQQGH